MYAIVEIAGQQFKVEKEQRIFVHQLKNEQGERVKFDKVLLYENNDDIRVGAPVVDSVQISTEVLEHCRGDKVKVFKKKRRKGYKVLNGHRQYLTQLLVNDIIVDGESTVEEIEEEVVEQQDVEQEDNIVDEEVVEEEVAEEPTEEEMDEEEEEVEEVEETDEETVEEEEEDDDDTEDPEKKNNE